MGRVQAHLRAYLAAVASLPGGSMRSHEGVVWCTTAIPWPMFNGVLADPALGDNGYVARWLGGFEVPDAIAAARGTTAGD